MLNYFLPVGSSSIAILSSTMMISMYSMAETPVQQLPVIEVQSLRTHTHVFQTPASVYKIEQNNNQNNANINLSEIIQGVAGLQVNNRENYTQDLQISMRGFGARSTFGLRGIRLYVDGIPATMPDGQGQSSNIDLNSLSNVEVLSGPFSSLYGNSSGGTILATTKTGTGQDSLSLGYLAGSHHKQQTHLILQGGAKDVGEPAYVLSSSYFNTDGFREHSGANKALTNAKLSWNFDDGSQFNWILNNVNINAADPGGLAKADWKIDPKQLNSYIKSMNFNSRKEIEQTQTGITWQKPVNEHHALYAMAYVGQREVIQYQTIPKGVASLSANGVNYTGQASPRHSGAVIDFDRNYYGLDLRWTGQGIIDNTIIHAGLALDMLDEDRQGYNNYQTYNNDTVYGVKGDLRRNEKNTQWNVDPYAQLEWQILPTWNLTTGLRYSNVHFKSVDHYMTDVDQYGTANGDDSGRAEYQKLLPSIAMGWTIFPELYAYASYGKGFETPTFTEISYKPSMTESGLNLALKPATSDSYEFGLKSDTSAGLWTMAMFRINTKNDIVSAGSYGGRSTFRNVDKTSRGGIELSWQKTFWEQLAVRASYNYIDAQFDTDISTLAQGKYIPGVARNQAFAQLSWEPILGFQAGIDVRYADKIYANDANTEFAEDYTVVGASMGYVWSNADWKISSYARIDNLFDRNYIGSVIINESNARYYEAADSRNLSAGLTISKTF